MACVAGTRKDFKVKFRSHNCPTAREDCSVEHLSTDSGMFTWRKKTLALGTSWRADNPSAICFLYSVYMQRARVVVVPRARTFLILGLDLPS